eukprot:gene2546-2917_t
MITIIEKLEKQLAQDLAFGVVLVTPDVSLKDAQGNPAPFIRPNVLIELGWLLGKLGRSGMTFNYPTAASGIQAYDFSYSFNIVANDSAVTAVAFTFGGETENLEHIVIFTLGTFDLSRSTPPSQFLTMPFRFYFTIDNAAKTYSIANPITVSFGGSLTKMSRTNSTEQIPHSTYIHSVDLLQYTTKSFTGPQTVTLKNIQAGSFDINYSPSSDSPALCSATAIETLIPTVPPKSILYSSISYRFNFDRTLSCMLVMGPSPLPQTLPTVGHVVLGNLKVGTFYHRSKELMLSLYIWRDGDEGIGPAYLSSTTMTIDTLDVTPDYTIDTTIADLNIINSEPVFAEIKIQFHHSNGRPFIYNDPYTGEPITIKYPQGYLTGRANAMEGSYSLLVNPFSAPQVANILAFNSNRTSQTLTYTITGNSNTLPPSGNGLKSITIQDLKNGDYLLAIGVDFSGIGVNYISVLYNTSTYIRMDKMNLDSDSGLYQTILTVRGLPLEYPLVAPITFTIVDNNNAVKWTSGNYFGINKLIPFIPVSQCYFTSATMNISTADVSTGPLAARFRFTLENNDERTRPSLRIEPQFKDDIFKANKYHFTGSWSPIDNAYVIDFIIPRGQLTGELLYTVFVHSVAYESPYLSHLFQDLKLAITSDTDNLPPMFSRIQCFTIDSMVRFVLTLDTQSVGDFARAFINLTSSIDPLVREFTITPDMVDPSTREFQINYTLIVTLSEEIKIHTIITEDTAGNHGMFKSDWASYGGGIDIVDPMGYVDLADTHTITPNSVGSTDFDPPYVDPTVDITLVLYEFEYNREVIVKFNIMDDDSGISDFHFPQCYLESYGHITLQDQADPHNELGGYVCNFILPYRWGTMHAVWSVYGLVDKQLNIGSGYNVRTTIPIMAVRPPFSCPESLANCNGNGLCTDTGCQCTGVFTGPSCNNTLPPPETFGVTKIVVDTVKPQSTIEVVIPANSTITPVITSIAITMLEELDANGVIVRNHSLANWSYSSNSSSVHIYQAMNVSFSITVVMTQYNQSTTVVFADQTQQMVEGSVKISATIQNYNFLSQLSHLRLVIEAQINGTLGSCTMISTDQIISSDLSWIKLQMNGQSVYGRFIERARVDYRIAKVRNTLINHKALQESNGLSNLARIGMDIPYFQYEAIIDPDFSILVEAQDAKEKEGKECVPLNPTESSEDVDNSKSPVSSGWKLYTVIAASCVAAIAILVGVGLVVKRNAIYIKLGWITRLDKSRENRLRKIKV